MAIHRCDERCSEPHEDGDILDCPLLRIQYTLWQLHRELEHLEKDIDSVLDLREE